MLNFKNLSLLLNFIAVLLEARVLKREGIHTLLSDDEVEKVFGTLPNKVPEYDVVHPVLLNDQGDFLSHDVTHDNKREAPKNLHFGVSAFGKHYHLDMKLNTDQLLAPGFVTEIRNNGESRYDRSVDHCHYLGHLVTDQGPGDKVALSNCDGLTGMIQSKKEVLMIRPLPKRLGLTKPTHVVYKSSHADAANVGRQFGIDVRSMPMSSRNQEPSNDDNEQEDDVYSTQFYIEALVVTDVNMKEYHGTVELLKKFVLTVMNIVHGLIGDASIGTNIKYVLKKLQILETYEHGFSVSSHAGETLSGFCKWADGQKANLKDSDEAYFDNAVLISRTPFCASSYDPTSSSCSTVLGLANLGGMCRDGSSCVLNTDNGLGVAFTIAHETGHNLGAQHDGEGNSCLDAVNIMARKASGKPSGYQWSSCSRDYVLQFLRGSQSSCLKDKPAQFVVIPTDLPGQQYTLDDQCKLMVKGSTGVCTSHLDKACSTLWCLKGTGCSTINEPAADGSNCGKDKFCKKGLCVDKSLFGENAPKPVDGGFSAWSDWSKCSHTCGGGVMVRTRKCDNPIPQNSGKPCIGDYKDFKYCVNEKCPSSATDPRETECNKQTGNTYWVYKPNMGSLTDGKRCKLICFDQSNMQSYSIFGAVPDGLRCDGNGPRGVCATGICKELGCDNVIGSGAKVDQCGVCKGDGSTCTINTVSKEYKQAPGDSNYQTITTIPVGAKDIEIKEVSDSSNYLALETKSQTPILNMNFYISSGSTTKTAAGTSFAYTQNGNAETITAKGPLTEEVVVKYLPQEFNTYHVTYKYSLVVKSSNDVSQDFAEDAPRWAVKGWQFCSKACNDGSLGQQSREVMCVMQSNGEEEILDDSDCKGPKPKTVQSCGHEECPAEWVTVKTSKCSATCGKGTMNFTIICQKTDTTGQKRQVSNAECPADDKPPATLSCDTDIPCE